MAAWGISRHLVGETLGWCPSKVIPGRDHLTAVGGLQPVRLIIFLGCASCLLLFRCLGFLLTPHTAASLLLSKSPHSKVQLGCHLPHEAFPELLQQEFVSLGLLHKNTLHVEVPVKSLHLLG